VHDEIGHLGIFVSGKVANKEHTEIANTLDLIESVAPGLYELRITGTAGSGLNTGYQVELVEKTLADIRVFSADAENEAFPAVARISAMNQMIYDLFASPIVRQFVTEESAELRRQMNPMRARRYLVSDANPMMKPLGAMADLVRANRQPVAPDNPFVAMERAWADSVERSIDAWRDWRDQMQETAFHAVYGTLSALNVASELPTIDVPPELAGETPDVRAALDRVAEGGYAEAVVRMMILLAKARGGVRRNRLARSNTLLTTEEPFAQLTASARQALIREQTVVVEMAPSEAFDTLVKLLATPKDRRRALATVEDVAGPEEELGEPARLRALLLPADTD
jgi:hypothetical protein